MATSKNVAGEFFGAITDVSNEVVERGLMIRSAGVRKSGMVDAIQIFKCYYKKNAYVSGSCCIIFECNLHNCGGPKSTPAQRCKKMWLPVCA